MPKTYWDTGTSHRAESWLRIRQMRAHRGHMNATKHKLFTSSLEQAEQQFHAAEHVPFESRPLNLFYGLSQAGRAIHVQRSRDSSSQLFGHGITSVTPSGVNEGNFKEFTVKDKGRGSFTQLAELLGSASLPTGGTMHELWNCLVEPVLHDQRLDTTGVTVTLVQRNFENPSLIDFSLPCNEGISSLADAEKDYPSLRGAKIVDSRKQFDPTAQLTPMANCQILIPAENNLWPYRASEVLCPAVAGNSLHPLLTWWAILYGLSTLARYEPTVWTDLLNVNSSSVATKLEYILELAIDSVPEIISETLNFSQLSHRALIHQQDFDSQGIK